MNKKKNYYVTATLNFDVDADSPQEAHDIVENLVLKTDINVYIESIDVQGTEDEE